MCGIPHPPGFSDNMILRNKPEQTGIAYVHRIIGGHPIIVFRKGKPVHRLPVDKKRIAGHSHVPVLMGQNRIPQQRHIPRIDSHGPSFFRHYKRMRVSTVLAGHRHHRETVTQTLRNEIILIMAETADIIPVRSIPNQHIAGKPQRRKQFQHPVLHPGRIDIQGLAVRTEDSPSYFRQILIKHQRIPRHSYATADKQTTALNPFPGITRMRVIEQNNIPLLYR